MKFLVLFLFFTQVSFAQMIETTPPLPTEGSEVVPELVKPEESPVEEAAIHTEPMESNSVAEKIEETKQELSNTRDRRAESTGTIMVGYQLITSWLPSKKTIGYTHIFNEKWSLEAEYSWATIDFPVVHVDLGEIRERRYTLQARRYVGNSFNFTFGPVLNDFKARLGSDFLDNLGNEIQSDFSVQNLGVTGGIGNRWQWTNGLTFGIDWIRINIPVAETKVEDNVIDRVSGESEQEDIKKVIRTFNRIPTFVLFGLNIGYTF